MYKIAIISRHSVANYGSLLQAYATEQVIYQLGYKPITINYTPYEEYGSRLAKTLINKSRWSKNLTTKIAFLLYQSISFKHTFNIFKKYRAELLNETQEYVSSDKIMKDLSDVDIFCTGSDQTWNVTYDGSLDSTYFLDFVPSSVPKISYAASFGGNEFVSSDKIYQGYLKQYRKILVREDKGVEILKKMGIKGEQVLDPTLLLSAEKWNDIVSHRIINEDYILIYQLNPNKEFDDYVMKFSKITGLPVYRVSTMYFQRIKCGKFIYLPSPGDFLSLIKYSKYFFTDSFHGTCFAINFNVNFIDILPNRFSTRNKSILKTLNLDNRILYNYESLEIPEKQIDYSSVYKELISQRNRSIQLLKNAIESQI